MLILDTVSQRGVVFFRNQSLTVDEQKILGQKLGELTGKPETSKVRRINETDVDILTLSSFIVTHSLTANEVLPSTRMESLTTRFQ
jgi:alpha-ketoglutarate-dependent taurine dioxygenase